LSHSIGEIAGHTVWLRRVAMVLPLGYLVAGKREAHAVVSSSLVAAGATACDAAALEAARIEAGWPSYGIDITEKNLPQEVGRDATAISFTKGCYLGQETVARIDALGHVNRHLVRLRFEGRAIPSPGAELTADGQPAGNVTSAAWSAGWQAPIALAYLRRGSDAPGTRIAWSGGAGEVVDPTRV
jgi:folate-binding protein YgfZ